MLKAASCPLPCLGALPLLYPAAPPSVFAYFIGKYTAPAVALGREFQCFFSFMVSAFFLTNTTVSVAGILSYSGLVIRCSAPIVPRGSAFRICLSHWQIHGSRRRAGARVSSWIFSFMVWGFFLTRGYRKRCWDFIVSGSCDSGLCPYYTPRLRLPYLPLANTRLPPSRWGASTWWDFWVVMVLGFS